MKFLWSLLLISASFSALAQGLNPMDDPNLAPRSPSSDVTQKKNAVNKYQKEVAKDLASLQTYQSQLRDMNHPACTNNRFPSFSLCFRAMVSTHPIRSMSGFEIFNSLAAEAANLDASKNSNGAHSPAEAKMHQVLLNLNYIENQIFIIEKVNSSDLLVNRVQTQSQEDKDIMENLKAAEKQRYISYWHAAHREIREKFDSVYKTLKENRKPAAKNSSTVIQKYKNLLGRYRKVHKDAIGNAYPKN